MTTPWTDVFEVRDEHGVLIDGPVIPMTQTSANEFRIDASLHYLGTTGLDPKHGDEIRTLAFDADRRSDLASIPAMLRWFENPYGRHTPAALFHDWFISEVDVLTPVEADLYFRNMLQAVGVPIFKRWIMWTGIVLRTRWVSSLRNKILLVIYVALALAGTTVFVMALADLFGVGSLPGWLGDPWPALIAATAAWPASSWLWGRQWPAALVAGAAAPWAIPASALALIGRTIYSASERLAGVFTT